MESIVVTVLLIVVLIAVVLIWIGVHFGQMAKPLPFSLVTSRSEEMMNQGSMILQHAIQQAIEEMHRKPPQPGDQVAHSTIIRTCVFLSRDEDGMAILQHPEMRHRRLRVPLDELYDPERVLEITARDYQSLKMMRTTTIHHGTTTVINDQHAPATNA